MGHPVVLRHSNVSLTQACCIEMADVDLRAAYERIGLGEWGEFGFDSVCRICT